MMAKVLPAPAMNQTCPPANPEPLTRGTRAGILDARRPQVPRVEVRALVSEQTEHQAIENIDESSIFAELVFRVEL